MVSFILHTERGHISGRRASRAPSGSHAWTPQCIPACLLDGFSWCAARRGPYLVWVSVAEAVREEAQAGLAQGVLLV